MKATVSEKGQVTIPKALRDKLGLKNGVILDFSEENGRLVAQKKITKDPIKKWIGAGKDIGFENTMDYINEIRDR